MASRNFLTTHRATSPTLWLDLKMWRGLCSQVSVFWKGGGEGQSRFGTHEARSKSGKLIQFLQVSHKRNLIAGFGRLMASRKTYMTLLILNYEAGRKCKLKF
jgi:hypothetical protein